MNQRGIYILFIALFLCGCSYNNRKQHFRQDYDLAVSLKVDQQIITQLRVYGVDDFEPAHYWFHKGYLREEIAEFNPVSLDGFTFQVKHPSQDQIFNDLKDNFREKGYSILVVDEDNISSPSNRMTLAVVKTTDKYQIIKQMIFEDSIHYTNYETNSEIYISVDRLNSLIKHLNDNYSLELFYASKGCIQFNVNGYVNDWEGLVREVFEVLPYALPTNDIGIVNIKDLAEEMKQDKKLKLWLFN